jgi:hypothetical protein
LVGDELFQIGVGEHLALAFGAPTDRHVTQLAGGDVSTQRLRRAAQPLGGFSFGDQPVVWGSGIILAGVARNGHAFGLSRGQCGGEVFVADLGLAR